MTSGQSRLTPSPGTMPNSKCGLSWNTVCGVARMMSVSSAYSECGSTGPVQGADHRYFDVEDVRENLATLTQDLVVALRAEEIETVGADCVHKSVTATGQDHHAVGLVLADHVEEMDELLMRMAVEDQLAAVSVKGDFEYAIRLTPEAGVREHVAIGIVFDHWGLLSTAVSRCR